MRLFESIQRVVEVGKVVKITVPASFSLIIDNKTEGVATLYHAQNAKIGFPLLSQSSMEIEQIPEASEFWLKIEENEIKENEGLYIIARPFLEINSPEQNNTVVINK